MVFKLYFCHSASLHFTAKVQLKNHRLSRRYARQKERMKYIRINEQDVLPSLEYASPFKCLVVISESVSQTRQNELSNWLVKSGCLVMCAWGNNCSSWDDSVDWASIELFNYNPIPPESFVLTTWHENEKLEEAMFFVKHSIRHEVHELEHVIVLHISSVNQEAEFSALYTNA